MSWRGTFQNQGLSRPSLFPTNEKVGGKRLAIEEACTGVMAVLESEGSALDLIQLQVWNEEIRQYGPNVQNGSE